MENTRKRKKLNALISGGIYPWLRKGKGRTRIMFWKKVPVRKPMLRKWTQASLPQTYAGIVIK